MQAKIKTADLEKWAEYLINHSLGGVNKEDVVMVKGEHICWPLMSVLQDKIIQAGAVCDINITAPDNDRGKVFGASMGKYGSPEQIKRAPEWQRKRYEEFNKFIEVLGVEDPNLFKGQKEELAQEIMRVDEELKNLRLSKKWCITLFPTQGFADMEGLSLEEYTDIVVGASLVDPSNLDELEEDLAILFDSEDTVTLETHCPHTNRDLKLTMNIKDRLAVKCTGTRNFPDGEVYTSPDARTVEGEIFVDLPVFQGGKVIQGIYLKFEGGKIINYKADKGHDALQKIIETDDGSHRLGEVALGMNTGMKKVLMHPLFVEKVGGTAHIAIGASYPTAFTNDPESEAGQKLIDELTEKGVYNTSAQHVDIVTDFRPGGSGRAVYIGETKLEIENDIWVVPKD
ncbi:MAG: aminopeptidase [Bacteroidetes bacterium]|nr:aminopeptidase [Bacteroidota bacterium]